MYIPSKKAYHHIFLLIMSSSISLQNTDLLGVLRHDFSPCTSGEPLSVYIREEKNGPFLRPLCRMWREMGSPILKSIEFFNINEKSIPHHQHDHDEVTLATLSLQQEFTVASFLRYSSTFDEAYTTLQPFSMFASQLDLFCRIKTDLLGLKNNVPEHKLQTLYDETWQKTTKEFTQHKESNCCNPGNKHDRCLGRLIWGT